MTVSHSVRSPRSRLIPAAISPQGLRRNAPAAPAGATRGIRKLTSVPTTAMPTSVAPIRVRRSSQTSNRNAPTEVPRMIATNVVISSRPFARERPRSEISSGTIPYFAGLKNVDCSAIRNSTASSPAMPPWPNATTASPIETISRDLVTTRTLRLLNRSASCPA